MPVQVPQLQAAVQAAYDAKAMKDRWQAAVGSTGANVASNALLTQAMCSAIDAINDLAQVVEQLNTDLVNWQQNCTQTPTQP